MKALSLLLVLFFSFSIFGQELQLPALRSPVVDQGEFLSPEEEQALSQKIYEIFTHNGPQITVLTVTDLQGYPIEDFSIKVAEKWQLGTKEKGNGLLILISKTDRKMRIEVGQGIEGDITDYDASLYIQKILKPAFKEGQFYEGLDAVISDVSNRFNINAEASGEGKLVKKISHKGQGRSIPFWIFPLLLLTLIVNLILKKRPVIRGVSTGLLAGGFGFAALGVAGMAMIAILVVVGFFIGIIGLNNILYALATSSGGGGHYRGGGFGGGSSGGGWSGGGGGFSGGGSSGDW